MKIWRRRALKIIGVILFLYSGICLYFRAVQIEKIFMPMKEIATTPERMGMPFTRVKIPVGEGADHAKLDGFWVPANKDNAPTFLYLHGQNATIGKNLEHTHRLHELGYNVLVIDYRGFGKNFDVFKPSEDKVYEDAEAAWNFLVDQKGCDPKQLFIFGHSLGGAVALQLAVNHPEAAGLITESTFTSVLEMTKLKYHGLLRALPIDLILTQRFDSIDKIKALKIPVLTIHGTADTKIPHTMTEKLYAKAPEPKELLLVKGGEHANCGSIGLVEYRKKIRAFVTKH